MASKGCNCDEAVRTREILASRNPYAADPPPSLPMTRTSEDGEVSCSYCWEILPA
jgi:hypothetical protein